MQELLKGEVLKRVRSMENIELGTGDYVDAITDVKALTETLVKLESADTEKSKVELMKLQEELRIEQEKAKAAQAEFERIERLNQQKEQLELQQKQYDLQKKQQKSERIRGYIQIGLVALGTLASIALPIWGTIEDQNREREGEMVTSYSGKKHRDGLFSKK